MTSTDKSPVVILRLVEPKDREILWEWVNDPGVREASFQGDSISWDMHKAWFDSRLRDSSCHFYMAVNMDGMPIGQIRFEREGKSSQEVTISISLDRNCRGVGVGVTVLKLGCGLYRDREGRKLPLVGYVKQNNVPSMKLFESAGFVHDGFVRKNNCKAVRWILPQL
tara:strand:- start:1603 stop:2103 length:501 start_codon:yes stop_codon:yes gene_type:complete